MADNESISHQQSLLAVYRRNLRHLLTHAAQYGGEISAPLSVVNGIRECRYNILNVKSLLRNSGILVDDLPEDEPKDNKHIEDAHIFALSSNIFFTRKTIYDISYQLFQHSLDHAEGLQQESYIISSLVRHISKLLSCIQQF